jgi:AcrR family transcriptional regulator
MPRLITKTVVADFRSRLCDVAADLFHEQGRDGFNMRELAKRLRVSPMTAYRYFKDKDEILAALRARAFARFAAQLESTHATAGSPWQRSVALARAYVAFVRQEEPSYRLMFDLFQPPAAAVPELLTEERRAHAALREHARLMIADGVYEGDADLIGEVFWAALHGVAALHLAGKLADIDRAASEAVRVLASAYCSGNAMPPVQWEPIVTPAARPQWSGMAALPAAE